jgi:hypothetical protein
VGLSPRHFGLSSGKLLITQSRLSVDKSIEPTIGDVTLRDFGTWARADASYFRVDLSYHGLQFCKHDNWLKMQIFMSCSALMLLQGECDSPGATTKTARCKD